MKQKIEHRNSKGQLHCENGPAIIKFFKNGNKKYEQYYLNDLPLEYWCKKYNISFEKKMYY